MDIPSNTDDLFPVTYYLSQNGKLLLYNLIGKKILRIFRYSICDTKNEHLEYLTDLLEKRHIYHSQIFSLMEGPVLFEFDSREEVLFFSDENMQSITFSYERDIHGDYKNMCEYYVPKDISNELYVDICDNVYSSRMLWECLNNTINDIRLYRLKNPFFASNYRVGDNVIVFFFEDERTLALGYGIDPNTNMMIFPWNSLLEETKNKYYEVLSIKNDRM